MILRFLSSYFVLYHSHPVNGIVGIINSKLPGQDSNLQPSG
jgi:hypothetical protein